MLPTKIKEQRNLMELAIRQLDTLEVSEKLLKDFDPVYCKIYMQDIHERYAEIMSHLLKSLLTVNKKK